MMAMQRGVLVARFLQLPLKAFDVLFALAQNIGTLLDEKKTRWRRIIPMRADGNKKVGVPSDAANTVHAALYRRTTFLLVKGDRLEVVLQKNCAMREELRERVAKFVELEFMGVRPEEPRDSV